MIHLRELKEQDAGDMLEWMHSEESKRFFKKNMQAITLDQAIEFCRNAKIPKTILNGDSLHFAVADENDEYLGTISLKNINTEAKSAEYAISMREKACGKGISLRATIELLRYGFEECKLHRIYLNVLADNKRAIRFYEKCGFVYEGEARDCLVLNGKYASLKYFGMLDSDYQKMMDEERK